MDSIYQKYTEQTYLDAQDFKNMFTGVQYEGIWQETLAYRQLFQMSLGQSFIVLFPSLSKRITRAEFLWLLCMRSGYEVFTLPSLPAVHAYYAIPLPYATLHAVCAHLGIPYKESYIIFDREEPAWFLLMALYYCMTSLNQQERTMLLSQLIHKRHIAIPSFLRLEDTVMPVGDATKHFMTWLTTFEEKCHHFLQKQELPTHLQAQHLEEIYPSLKDYQAHFFEQHRTSYRYYTVNQFAAFCNTSYETARTSMDFFVQLGWYHKKKYGKKYVYSIAAYGREEVWTTVKS